MYGIYARHILDTLSRTPFVDSTELVGILGEPHSTVHRVLTDLLADEHCRQAEPRSRSPDGGGYWRSRLDAWFRHTLGLRAGLSHV